MKTHGTAHVNECRVFFCSLVETQLLAVDTFFHWNGKVKLSIIPETAINLQDIGQQTNDS